METIDKHINDIIDELNSSIISKQRRRHLEDELSSLTQYKTDNPDDTHVPSSLELYCNLNPNALECRIYE